MTSISVQNAVDSGVLRSVGVPKVRRTYDFHLEDAGLQLAISVRRADFLLAQKESLRFLSLSSKKAAKAKAAEPERARMRISHATHVLSISA
jgi:hypothetical protein